VCDGEQELSDALASLAEGKLEELIAELVAKGYQKAAT
jgi:hypothetical protein